MIGLNMSTNLILLKLRDRNKYNEIGGLIPRAMRLKYFFEFGFNNKLLELFWLHFEVMLQEYFGYRGGRSLP